MIICRTPFRISFVGGGSDLENFYSKQPGRVLSTTINKYMYIYSHRFFDQQRLRVKYSKTETVASADYLKHPILREVLRKFGMKTGLEISSNADIPAGTGLGSSSSFTVGLLHNMYTRVGKYASKELLAEEACDIEINRLGEPIGKQDQYAASFGGLNVFTFRPSGQVDVEPIHLQKEVYKKLQRNLLMFYTGITRSASTVLTEQRKNLQSGDEIKTLEKMVGLVEPLRMALYQGDLEQFGDLLHQNWLLKQTLAAGVSDERIKALYETGIANGALGGKLLGAGGGGFLLFYCGMEKQEQLRAALADLRELRFKFENEGTRIIHVADEYEES